MVLQKLKSKNGATMLLALLAFLVITAVSAMLIHAAYSAAKLHSVEYSQRQAMLSASSAAYLVRDSLENDYIAIPGDRLLDAEYHDTSDEALKPLKSLLCHWSAILAATPSREQCTADFSVEADELGSVNVKACLSREQLVFVFNTGDDSAEYCLSLCFQVKNSDNIWRLTEPEFLKGDCLEASK